MKYLILTVFVILNLSSFSQKRTFGYIEIRGNVDALGNIYLYDITKPKKLTNIDSLIDYSTIKKRLNYREPITVINALSEIGWVLISVTQISSDKNDQPITPFILYYFRKEFKL